MLFGSSAIAFVQNPWTIAFAIITTILAIYFAYRGIKKNGGKGGLQRNLTTTFLVIASFMFGYLFAAYQTHDYFESRTHHDAMDGELTETPAVLPMPSDNSVSESVKMYTDMMDRVKNLSLGIENKENENSKKNNEYNGTGCHNDFNSFL